MKKVISTVLALTMVFSLMGCSKGEKKNDDQIVIGCLQDVTGNTSSLGISVQKGAQAAVDKLNADGGIDGKKIVMKTYDTKGDVTEAVNAYLTAAEVDKVDLIVGPPVANIANAIKDTTEEFDVPVVGLALDPSAQIKEDGSVYKNMFCLQPNADSQGRIMGSFAVKNGFKSFGVIYNEENAYSVSLLKPFLDTLAEKNITIDKSAIVTYGASDTDYKTLLQPIIAANVDAIYAPNYTQQLVNIVTAARELGYKGAIITGLDGCPSFNTTYGKDCTGVYYINNIDVFNDETAEILSGIEGSVSAPNKYFLGYDIIMASAECIKKVGVDDSKKLVESLSNLTYDGLTGTFTIDPATHMIKNAKMYMYTYDNLQPVFLEEFGE